MSPTPAHPQRRWAGYIDTPTMRDPGKSLRRHNRQARKLLGGAEAENGTGTGNGFEIYDVSDCRHPTLKGSLQITDSHAHAGGWTPDGKFYYITQGFRGVGGTMPIVDTADAANPRLVTTWKFTGDGRGATTPASNCRRNANVQLAAGLFHRAGGIQLIRARGAGGARYQRNRGPQAITTDQGRQHAVLEGRRA